MKNTRAQLALLANDSPAITRYAERLEIFLTDLLLNEQGDPLFEDLLSTAVHATQEARRQNHYPLARTFVCHLLASLPLAMDYLVQTHDREEVWDPLRETLTQFQDRVAGQPLLVRYRPYTDIGSLSHSDLQLMLSHHIVGTEDLALYGVPNRHVQVPWRFKGANS